MRHGRMHVLPVCLIAGLAIVAFAPALDGGFLNWDDDRNFLQNEAYRGVGPGQVAWAWNTYHLGVWQPISWMLLGLQWRLSGTDPVVYHGVSLALHVVICYLFFFLAVRVIRISRGPADDRSERLLVWSAAAVTVLFAVHPLRVEAVAWVSAQPYLPSVLLFLLAVLVYLPPPGSGCNDPSALRWTACLILYGLAVASKAVAVSLPVVLLILDVYPLRRIGLAGASVRSWARVIVEKIPFFIVAVLVAIWAAEAKDANVSRAPLSEFDAGARLANAAYGLTFYLQKCVAPLGLSPYYRLPEDIGLWRWPYGFCAVICAGVTIVAGMRARQRPSLAAAWAAYLVILLPNVGLVQISQQLAADRYAYLATMPPATLLAGWLSGWLAGWPSGVSHGRRALGATMLVMGISAAVLLVNGTRRQLAYWHDSEALWGRVLALDPRCAVAHTNLGQDLLATGDLSRASTHLSAAIDLEPDFSYAWSNFAALLCEAGRYRDAIAAAELALAGDASPRLAGLDLARTHAILGQAYAGLGDDERAMEHTVRAKVLGFGAADRMIEYLQGRTPTEWQPGNR